MKDSQNFSSKQFQPEKCSNHDGICTASKDKCGARVPLANSTKKKPVSSHQERLMMEMHRVTFCCARPTTMYMAMCKLIDKSVEQYQSCLCKHCIQEVIALTCHASPRPHPTQNAAQSSSGQRSSAPLYVTFSSNNSSSAVPHGREKLITVQDYRISHVDILCVRYSVLRC